VLIQIVYRPCLLILKNKLRIKAREMRDYTETLNIIAGSMDEWLSKLVQLPLASIVQEKGFQFDPEEVAFNAQPLRIRMLQLKVPIFLLTYLPIYLPTYLPTCLPMWQAG
jgi:hypothetical protein